MVFDDRDSGRDSHTVIYEGAPNLGTRIYGGRRLTGWTKMGLDTYSLEVPDLQRHYTLYEDDRAAQGGMFHTFYGIKAGTWNKQGTTLIYHPRKLPIKKQTIVLGTTKDVIVVHGRSMKQIARHIVFQRLYLIGSDFAAKWKKGATWSTNWNGKYDGRDWNGESLFDNILAPDMRHGQFFLQNAKDIVIRDSKLYGAGFMAVMMNRWDQDNRVENCWIENAGCNGIFAMGWEPNRGPFKSAKAAYVNRGNVIRNNVFYDIGRFAFDGGGVYLTFSGDNLIENNIFHGITRYGVSIKGWTPSRINQGAMLPNAYKGPTWGNKNLKLYGSYVVTRKNQGAAVLYSRNNIVRYNDLSQIPRTGDDSGMIEMWGAGTGNRWEVNACHDMTHPSGWNTWMHVLFNDDGSHEATLRGNIIFWIAGGKLTRLIMNKGIDQNTCNNVMADCDVNAAADIMKYSDAAFDMHWDRNIVSGRFKRWIVGGGHPLVKSQDNNLYHLASLNPENKIEHAHKIAESMLREVRRDGFEAHSIVADPEFVCQNPWWKTDASDYQLQAGSPALRLGFEPIDTSLVGLRVEDFPFELAAVMAHPGDRLWKASNDTRLYKVRNNGKALANPIPSDPIAAGAWARYAKVDFGQGEQRQFQCRINFAKARQTYKGQSGGEQVLAKFIRTGWKPIPGWEASPLYKGKPSSTTELLSKSWAPVTDPDSVKWQRCDRPTLSRAGVVSPPGVVDLDVFHGEEHVNCTGYLRSSVYSKSARKVEFRINGRNGVRFRLNGKVLFTNPDMKQTHTVRARLNAGWNRILVQVAQDNSPWKAPSHGLGNFWVRVEMNQHDNYWMPGLPGKAETVQPSKGAAIQLRLGSPGGRLIGSLPYGESTCPIESVRGRHGLFLVFPAENVTMLDWFRFQ